MAPGRLGPLLSPRLSKPSQESGDLVIEGGQGRAAGRGKRGEAGGKEEQKGIFSTGGAVGAIPAPSPVQNGLLLNCRVWGSL